KPEEGNLWIRATLPSTISLETGIPYATAMRDYLKSQPMIETVVSQIGRRDDGMDATGFFNVEFFASLASFSDRARWGNLTKPKLIDKLSAEMSEAFPGIILNFSQSIEDRIEHAMSGVNGENSIKLFGDDIDMLEDLAEQIRYGISKVRGIEEPGVFRASG